MERMSGMDAAFLYMETPAMHMHVIGVVLLDPSPVDGPFGAEEITVALRQRLHLIPPLRRRAVAPPAGIDHPLWIEDPEFDLANHVARAPLTGPVDWAGLERYVGEVASRPLDRSRPLWEMWVVEDVVGHPPGAAAPAGEGKGRPGHSVALVTKLHHSIMDGAAGGDLMASLFDLTPDAPPVPPPESPWEPDRLPSSPALVLGSIRSLLARQREVPASVRRTFDSMAGSARTWLDQRRSGTAAPLTAPRTPINGALGPERSVSLAVADLDRVREIRRAFGTTVNDVVLAATGSALRAVLPGLGQGRLPADHVVVAVPVNARPDGGGAGDSGGAGNGGNGGEAGDSPRLGNRVSNMMVSVPLEPADPVARLAAVHEHALSSKALHSAFGPEALRDLTGLAAPPVMTAGARLYSGLKLARYHRPVANLIVSNVPGPPIDLFCAGARVSGIYPMGPIMEGMGVNVTVLSEAHHLNVGIMACPGLLPDADALGRAFVEALNELEARAATAG